MEESFLLLYKEEVAFVLLNVVMFDDLKWGVLKESFYSSKAEQKAGKYLDSS